LQGVHVSFTELPDLAAEAVGGRAVVANDEFFAEKENLLKRGRGIFDANRFTDRGKWMDGWETRRRREPGYDWCVVKLGMPGIVEGIDIDTNHFLGNFPERASLEVCVAPDDADADALAAAHWTEVLTPSLLRGGSRNLFPITHRERVTHVRLNIFPDGGVARLRVHGTVQPTFEAGASVDLAALTNGGQAVSCNDMFFGNKNNLISPGEPENMGAGWETQRRRKPGNDWIVVKLAARACVERLEVDTTHFKGNCPDRCSVEWLDLPDDEACRVDFANDNLPWTSLLGQTKLTPHTKHVFDELQLHLPMTHVRLSIYPDGGVARFRVFGEPEGATT
jgi:allantoicase